jgi:predicted glycoside hydrolase/deacetylase ChbG (UPF0249 family)
MPEERYLAVVADDFGIGPAPSRGILELAAFGSVTATVLLVNSPHADDAVRAWRKAVVKPELGWHPCLTLDRPILPPERVPGLVDAGGNFHPLGRLMRRLLLGRVRRQEVEDELRAQYTRYRELTGAPPALVNVHHHLQVFALVGGALRAVLDCQSPRPYVRRVREPWRTLVRIPGARTKRLFLNQLGRAQARQQAAEGYPGNDWLLGITDPARLDAPDFFARWLRAAPGRYVELTCHPGHLDAALVGRDGSFADGQVRRRPREWDLLRDPAFRQAIRDAGFTLVRPSQMAGARIREDLLARNVPA